MTDKTNTPNPRTLVILMVTWVAVVITVTLCAIIVGAFAALSTVTTPADEPARRQTELLLQAVQDYSGTPIPDDLPVYRIVAEQCWEFLQEAITRNEYLYQVVVAGIFGEGGTPTGHGATEVVIHVDFPDGTQAELYYYNSTLENCQEIAE